MRLVVNTMLLVVMLAITALAAPQTFEMNQVQVVGQGFYQVQFTKQFVAETGTYLLVADLYLGSQQETEVTAFYKKNDRLLSCATKQTIKPGWGVGFQVVCVVPTVASDVITLNVATSRPPLYISPQTIMTVARLE